MRVIVFQRNCIEYLGLAVRETSITYYLMTKEKDNHERPSNPPTRYWTINKAHCYAEYELTGKIFRLLYA